MKTSCSQLTTLMISFLLLSACASSPDQAPVPDGYYRVQRGDTLYSISQRFRQTATTLARWNQLSNPARIEVGQVLRVKAHVAPRPTSTPQAINSLQLQWPTDGNIITHYNGNNSKGIIIANTQGTPIKAAAAGEVMYAGNQLRGYGNLILIRHNARTITAYAHNDTLLVKEGQHVQAGQQIATMGNSDAERAQLHFEVRVDGKAVNPLNHLIKR